MRITSGVEYATRLMVSLAREHGKTHISAERLSETENIPADYVAQLLVKLRKAGLVISHRGSTGGYALARSPSQLTLGQVARAVEGEIFEDVCGKFDGGEKDCRHQKGCSISPVWRRLGALITQYFDGLTLAALLEDSGACGAEPAWLDKIGGKK